jgi:hypothetical protein
MHAVKEGVVPRFNRRDVMMSGLAMTLPWPALAANAVGEALRVEGDAVLTRVKVAQALEAQAALFDGDHVRTGVESFAELLLASATRIHLGPQSEVGIDRFIADLGGEISIGGQMVFDRPDNLPKLDLTFRNAFAEIGVRGTRFFAGQSKEVFAVFVERGEVEVRAAGVAQIVKPGEGVNIVPGEAPTQPVQWGQARIEAAMASVGL